MPLDYEIDSKRRLVMAKGRGAVTDQDLLGYQCAVWLRPEVAGYSELVDMSAVERIVEPNTESIRQLARLSASMDSAALPSKFAIVAPQHLAYGLGRMYATFRSLDENSTKQVAVFRTLAEALAYLGVEA
ncbi:MAG: hypothetical protein HY040_28490 [Planctomycetes bacterium]|nr:hypothetical protein [Planctomycetota bacterium]